MRCLQEAFPTGRSGDPETDLERVLYCVVEQLYPDETWPPEAHEAAKLEIWRRLEGMAAQALEHA